MIEIVNIVFDVLVYAFLISFSIMILVFYYENEKFKYAYKLFKMGRKEEAKRAYKYIDQYFQEGGEV